jgi:hypothetical protein
MDFHSILGKLRAIESLGRRDSVYEAEECNMTAEGEMCPVHGMEECAGYQGTIQMEDSRGEMMDEESDHERDDRAEKAGREVAHDIEYDERHKDHIHGHKRGSEDDKAERAGREVTKDIEWDEMNEESDVTRDDRAEKAGRKVAHDIEYDERHKDHIHGHRRGSEDDKAERAGRHVAKDIEYDEMNENMEEGECNMTAEGEMCPVHGMEECWSATMEEDAPLGPIPFTPIGATNNGPSEVGYVYAYNESQKQLRESLNIVMNQTIDDQGSHKSMTVTATDEDFETLERLLAMSGIGHSKAQAETAPKAGMPYGVSAEPTCQHCGNPESACTCEEVAMENADHDYGHDEHPEAGEPLDVKDYVYQGRHINQRFGKIGDNTLMAEQAERADSLFNVLNEEYTNFLIEAELENSNAGSESPLTANSRDTFDKDPFSNEEPVTDGSRSPLSHIGRQDVMN